eukprot:Gb_36685 [translate_table: standard]
MLLGACADSHTCEEEVFNTFPLFRKAVALVGKATAQSEKAFTPSGKATTLTEKSSVYNERPAFFPYSELEIFGAEFQTQPVLLYSPTGIKFQAFTALQRLFNPLEKA